ncbi:hypothetical protein A4X13_0g8847 [Tilletia indica]|uniref:Uncharacterized protein n=1 Tax=Tilletia indica TaxID=43049 RepID=A0A177SZ51_9BASI|nr:hypothetical protein A4X13_0g8847 [Tilletia indica]
MAAPYSGKVDSASKLPLRTPGSPGVRPRITGTLRESRSGAYSVLILIGGLIVVAVGDPRQTAPVTKENTQQSSLESSFLSSPLFPQFIITELEAAQRQAGDAQLSAWVDLIGDDYHQHPIDMSLYFAQATSLQDAMSFLFPPNVLSDPRRVVNRCFLTPLNVNVDEFNDMVSEHLPGVEHVKYSYDSLKDVERTDANAADIDAALATLSHLTHPGIPDHELRLKVGQICSILRNIND